MNVGRIVALIVAAWTALSASALADPGTTWTQERAWLSANPFVLYETIDKAYDKDIGASVGTATIKGGKRRWVLHAVLDKNDLVTEETYTFSKGGSIPSLQIGNRAAEILIKRMYQDAEVAQEYATATSVATVPIYNNQGSEEFYAAKGGKFGFMLDPYEVVVFRASELKVRIDQAKYCSTHKECGE